MAATKNEKSVRKLERHFKGLANHWRIAILLTVSKQPDISLVGICEKLRGHIKTISEHTRKLVIAGLIEKSYSGRDVRHSLTPYGEIFVQFVKSFGNLR